MSKPGLQRDVTAGVHGLVGVALNLAAVAFLQAIPHTYRPNTFAEWLAECRAAPGGTAGSSWSFTLGLTALAIFAFGLIRAARGPGGRAPAMMAAGLWWVGIGALLDAAGTMAPMAALSAGDDAGRGLLRFTLSLDATFNVSLGIGLLLINLGAGGVLPKSVRVLGVVAGLVSLPVGFQYAYDWGASLLLVASPLWLGWMVWVSVLLLRAPRAEAANA